MKEPDLENCTLQTGPRPMVRCCCSGVEADVVMACEQEKDGVFGGPNILLVRYRIHER